MDLRVDEHTHIPERELEWRFDPSGGPGGQHANRSATRATLEFDVVRSTAFTDDQRTRILQSEPARMLVTVDESRSQWRNRQIARRRLLERIRKALAPPPPARKPTKPRRAARERRLAEKRRRSETKKQRRRPEWD